MCNQIMKSKKEPAEGVFRKGNEPEGKAYRFRGHVAPCACGKNLWFLPEGQGMTPVKCVSMRLSKK
jgi:hypothetical protein